MKTEAITEQKQILQDPVATYEQQHPSPVSKDISTIKSCQREIQTLLALQKEKQDQCGVISRQIGQKKREGSPADKLKTEMRQHSTELKSIKSIISQYEDQILAFFSSEITADEDRQSNDAAIRKDRNTEVSACDIEKISVSLFDGKEEEWNDYVDNHPAGTLYHRMEWRDLILNTHSHTGHYYAARNAENDIVGVLPLIHLKSRLFGNFMVSMPYFNYGGAIADHTHIENLLMTAANDYAIKTDIRHIEYRDDVRRQGMQARTDKVNMILELPATHEQLWAGFSAKLRAQIRRPQKEQPQVLLGNEELLKDFYTVFARNMRDLGTPVYSKSFFRNILLTYPDRCKIIVIKLGRRPVAAGFLIGHNASLEIPWASTIKVVNHLSINMLLYWEVLKFATGNQYRYFDFGRSSKDSGTFRFKQQWGATPKQLYWHYWLPHNSKLPELNPNNPKYALAINVWKKIPVFATKWLGPYIVKNLP